MNTGMLWFDNDPKTDLVIKVCRAANYYQNKYGRKPDLCFVHPSMLNQKRQKAEGIEIRSSRQILPNHFWLGISNRMEPS
ncbi:MAG: hypothetical protein HPY45_05870 [Anaerolineae bacterium]|nr:hypothetical protein [Anaerolineae bacterium]